MSPHKQIAVFDFDGTITRKDTLIEFLHSTHGNRFYLRFASLLPMLLLYKIGLIRNDRAKQIILRNFYKGWPIERFDQACADFVQSIRIRPMAIASLQKHLSNGDSVVIVSASPENWVRIWALANGVEMVLGTQLEVDDDKRITGRFTSPNCYGAEKVHRLCKTFPQLLCDRSAIHLTAYGDSRGDRELLAFADSAHFKLF